MVTQKNDKMLGFVYSLLPFIRAYVTYSYRPRGRGPLPYLQPPGLQGFPHGQVQGLLVAAPLVDQPSCSLCLLDLPLLALECILMIEVHVHFATRRARVRAGSEIGKIAAA